MLTPTKPLWRHNQQHLIPQSNHYPPQQKNILTPSSGHIPGSYLDVEIRIDFTAQVANMVRQSVLKPLLDINHHRKHFINSVIFPGTRTSLEYCHLIRGKEGAL